METQLDKYQSKIEIGMTVHYVDMGNSVSAKVTDIFDGGIEVETSDFYFRDDTKKDWLFFGEIQEGWSLSNKSLQEINYKAEKSASKNIEIFDYEQ